MKLFFNSLLHKSIQTQIILHSTHFKLTKIKLSKHVCFFYLKEFWCNIEAKRDDLESRRREGMRREKMGEERKGLLWCKKRNLVTSTSNGCKCESTLIHFHPPCHLMLVKPTTPLFLYFQTHLLYAISCWCHWNSTICIPTA